MTATAPTPHTTALADPKQMNFRKLCESAQRSMAEVIPKHLTPDRLIKVALVAASRNPTLYDCSQQSILKALITAAELGLDPGGSLGSAYLVPYWNSKIKKFECQLIPGYRGLMDLGRRSGVVSRFSSRIVCENDRFELVYGTEEKIWHVPNLDDPGEKIGVYAVAFLQDGTTQFEYMTRKQIETIKGRSKSRDKDGKITGPWATDEDEMWRKTVVRRISKYLPLSSEMPLARAFEAEDEAEGIIHPTRERAAVDVAGLLNAPREEGVVVDLDSIRPVEPVPPGSVEAPEQAPKQEQVGEEDPPWEDAVPSPPPAPTDPAPAKKGNPKKPTLMERALQVAHDLSFYGTTIPDLEAFIGLPVDKWTEGIVSAMGKALAKVANGEPIEKLIPQLFAKEEPKQ